MPGDQTFEQQLKSHVGGLVRVADVASGRTASVFNGKIGLLLGAELRGFTLMSMMVELLIDGSAKKLLLYPGELELLGADDAK